MSIQQTSSPPPSATKTQGPRWGSDLIAEQLRSFGIPYISLTPGSSYRGLHDSIVNHLGNSDPGMVLCLAEEHAVAVAHGYAKATERPMLVALHANVGLMHAVMAIYNAYCDRVPMLIIGANGPVDAAERRPWIDWLHSSGDPGALIRQFVRWDDSPVSLAASLQSLVRGLQLTTTYPSAPAYVCLDVSVQEQPFDGALQTLSPDRYRAPRPAVPAAETVADVAVRLRNASTPVILCGRVSRDVDAWERRVRLAEALSARVGTDLRVGSTFPTAHPLHVGAPGYMPRADLLEAVREADVILSLDWVDLGGILRAADGGRSHETTVISCTADSTLHNGWSRDHFELSAADIHLGVEPDVLVDELVTELLAGPASAPLRPTPAQPERESGDLTATPTIAALTTALRAAVEGRDVCLARVPLGWASERWHFNHPLDCLGADGGGGVGSGPGMTVGAALALRYDDRLVIGVLGDGDTLMGASALWTAAHLNLPMLVIVANNGSFYNDEIHQGRMAARRDRPAENAWIGVRIDGPRPDLAEHVKALGLTAFGPITTGEQLEAVLPEAVSRAQDGPVVVDVHIVPDAYQLG
jgi:thiamine pyrophosphate-dependent acetolactate synthase large subunit-like protein